jgi:hypothetical protein
MEALPISVEGGSYGRQQWRTQAHSALKAGDQTSPPGLRSAESVQDDKIETQVERPQDARLGICQAIFVQSTATSPSAARRPDLNAVSAVEIDNFHGSRVARISAIRALNKSAGQKASGSHTGCDGLQDQIDAVAFYKLDCGNRRPV